MRELRLNQLTIAAADLGPVNPLPPFGGRDLHHVEIRGVDEEMARNIAYGKVRSVLPYLMQDGYTRDRHEIAVHTAVLENSRLRAEFLLDYGARLWSLIDQETGRELLHRNQILQPANLALRNAWFAGGVEWNLGTTGHSALTCAPLHAARLTLADGTPVLRVYEFERMRELVYAIDFWLPDDSPVLLTHARIDNRTAREVPVYWWSNIAVPQTERTRVIAPADSAYHFGYARELPVVPVPEFDGADVTYPARAQQAADYFFDARAARPPWIAAVDADGVGLLQASTVRLAGRKLFVWGDNAGGRRWQEFLSGPDSRYCEIQAGLARTQLEHLPMRAGARWSWVEAYGMAQVDPRSAHGDWDSARAAVSAQLAEVLPPGGLATVNQDALAWADRPPEALLRAGSGWGALERRRRAAVGEPALDLPGTPFADETLGEEQQQWLALAETGILPDQRSWPISYAVSPSWRSLLDAAPVNPTVWLHRGVAAWAAGDSERARQQWTRAAAAGAPDPRALRNLGAADMADGDPDAAAEQLLAALSATKEGGPSGRGESGGPSADGVAQTALTVETLAALVAADRSVDALAIVDGLPAEIRAAGRVRLHEAWAALGVGDLARLGAILRGGIAVDDIKEGENSLSDLWFRYHYAVAEAERGRSLNDAERAEVRAQNPPPAIYDFRMG
jgi:hypothetical protein